MATAEVTVQRLRLRSRAAVPGLVPNVEDALRVSSKPVALLNRLVLVRRLRLRTAAGASAQALAQQLERAWQQLAALAQPIEQASDTADAVWATSLAVARQALLRRWLRGEPTEAWFWRRLHAPHADGAWPERAVALLLAVDEEAAPAGVIASLRQQALQARALLALIAQHRMTAPFIQAITETQAQAVLGRIRALDEAPPLAHRPLPAASPAARAVAPWTRLFELMTALSSAAEDSPAERFPASSLEITAGPTEKARLAADADAPALPAPRPPAIAAMVKLTPRPLAASPSQLLLDPGLASRWSGLWLLLPLLLRHGLDDTNDPLAAWAGAMRSACHRLRIPGDDPIHNALAGLDLPTTPDPHWLRTARVAAVQDARLPLLRIARRRGAAWISPERIDIEFPPASLDLRIRRAGFDINPGFVPWLGRIVHFHYPS
ncbi:hypothetical protein J2X20_004622 [Pelomonas saccharophila]|uniref:Uncharacterized protein n=1 Tax=Roseateles saccharophilus TaxID=304 RepID=A0ABU1YT96_ROSSA|nr:hypothetical protein [Roseateles saccharophilus]MDR7271948.1 hypothetical protein [Roseateles saccharophilus]